MSTTPEEAQIKIQLIQEIVKGGVSVILSVGLLALFGAVAWILYQQTQIQRENMERQTRALEDISRTYIGH